MTDYTEKWVMAASLLINRKIEETERKWLKTGGMRRPLCDMTCREADKMKLLMLEEIIMEALEDSQEPKKEKPKAIKRRKTVLKTEEDDDVPW